MPSAQRSRKEVKELFEFAMQCRKQCMHDCMTVMQSARILCVFSEKLILEKGVPAYITSVGWMGYSDEKIVKVSSGVMF
jgi:hypothetical protein